MVSANLQGVKEYHRRAARKAAINPVVRGWLGGMRTVGVLGKHGLDAMDFVVAAAGVMGHGSTGTAEGES